MESKQQHINAIELAERWKDLGDEKQDSQRFGWIYLHSVFGLKKSS